MKNTILFIIAFLLSGATIAQKKIQVLKIRDAIDKRMSRYVRLGLEEALKQNVDMVIIDMDTYGGAVNDADSIRTQILNFPKPIHVFINKNAASAGALISIACDSIYMAKGATMGAATVVSGTDGSKAPDKYQSYMRGMMRSTAEAKGRNPEIAQAMVDENIEVEGISKKGEVLTFTVTEAIKNNFCDAEVSNIEEVIKNNNIENYELIEYQPDTIEKIISFFMNPFLSGILILIILGGIYYELQSPGIGFPLAAAIIAGLLYLTPYYLNGLAENWEILLLVVGLILIALEVFVIPGFGVAGISGITCTVGSLILIMLDNQFLNFTFVPLPNITRAILTVLSATFSVILLILISGSRIANSPIFDRVSLQKTQRKEEGFTSKFNSNDMVGKTGVAYTVLRPGGTVKIEGQLYDASTESAYIEKGEEIIVIGEEVTSLKVRKKKK